MMFFTHPLFELQQLIFSEAVWLGWNMRTMIYCFWNSKWFYKLQNHDEFSTLVGVQVWHFSNHYCSTHLSQEWCWLCYRASSWTLRRALWACDHWVRWSRGMRGPWFVVKLLTVRLWNIILTSNMMATYLVNYSKKNNLVSRSAFLFTRVSASRNLSNCSST